MKKRRKLKSWPITLTFFLVVFGILIYCVIDIKSSLLNKKGSTKVQVLDKMDDYDYLLNENDPKYFKSLFKLLKKELEKDPVNEENYASLISQLFIVDFFSLDSAINKNDIGGEQFVYKDYRPTFLKFAKDGIYKYVENNIYKNRKQQLPIVSKVEITDVKSASYTSNSGVNDESAFYVSVKISYEVDMQYQTVATLTLVHNDNKR